jgi:hypothetical protein
MTFVNAVKVPYGQNRVLQWFFKLFKIVEYCHLLITVLGNTKKCNPQSLGRKLQDFRVVLSAKMLQKVDSSATRKIPLNKNSSA